ncbi:MAG TPA: nitronate monooxygenase [Ramlibacter sp.]|nr:nitronate monooxygenase [Ramlibacter sp.]
MAKFTSLAGLQGLPLPLIQAPMAGVQGSALALAVGAAGALGSLPAAMLTAEALERELGLLAAAGQPYNVNFFCHAPPTPDAQAEARWREALAPYFVEAGIDAAAIPAGPGRRPFDAEMAAVLERARPPVVSFHFGLPEPQLLARVKALGATVLASATTVDEARWLVQHGADAVIAQGLEAGGHRGHFLDMDLTRQMGTLALLPQVVAAVDVPVIAAGGIATAQGVAAAMALGAAAVQVGTAFLLCPEATTTAVHRAALQSPQAAHTALTRLFTGRPARGIVNRLIRELGALSDAPPAFPLATAAIAPLRAWGEKAGHGEFSPLWAGQYASAARAVPAAEVVRSLAAGFDRA